MSVVLRDGRSASLAERRETQAEFLLDLFSGWHQGDRYRMRCVATLQMKQAGWSFRKIGRILGVHHSNAVRMHQRAVRGLRGCRLLEGRWPDRS